MSTTRTRIATIIRRSMAASLALVIAALTFFSAGCSEEEVVACFRLFNGGQYCVKIPESTECYNEDVLNGRAHCIDKDGTWSYPAEFEFDDGEIWVPNW